MATPVKTGSEFQVNTYTTGDQQAPSVTALSDGGFVVTWMSDGLDGSGYGIYGQRYDASGATDGAEFQINSFTTNSQQYPSVTALSDGGFVVTWQSYGQDGTIWGIYGQIYDASGVADGGEFRVSTYAYDYQYSPSITALSDGGFVVTWMSNGQDGSNYGVYGRRYDASGATDGAEFQINSCTTSNQLDPSVTALSDGGFVVTWMSNGQDGSGYGIYGQRYDSNGATDGSEFQVNTETSNSQTTPLVTAFSGGGFVVTWMSNGQDGSNNGVYGQRYNANGSTAGSEFQINSYTTGHQYYPSVTALSDGGFVVTWQSDGQDGFSNGVFGQIFSYASADFTAGDDNVTLYGPGQSVDGLAGADTITGADYATGSDIINGGGGNDIITGLAGDDTIDGGADDDALDGGDDTDTASYASAGAGVTVSLALQGSAQNTIGAGNDTLSNFENLSGSGFADTLKGDNNANRIEGGAGNDKLYGNGGKGKDKLFGGDGKDKLYGGKGKDKLTGGAGKDQFVFAKKEGKDIITDFESGKEKIDLSAFNFASKAAALAKFYEIGSGSNDKMGFEYKGTEIIIKGIDMGDLNGADIII